MLSSNNSLLIFEKNIDISSALIHFNFSEAKLIVL
jgi:hypothetical protein